MKLSIITVTYNSEDTIEQTIKSVIYQDSCWDVEYIIIDGKSTDRTCDILCAYDDYISKWLSESDHGIYHAMNKGICMATGDWVGIINSDDWYAENCFDVVAEIVGSMNTAAAIVGGVVRVGDKCMTGKRVYPPLSDFSTLQANNHPATFVRRDVYKNIGGFDLEYPISSDIDLIMRIQDSSDYEVIKTNDTLSYMREGGASSGFEGVVEAYDIERSYSGIYPANRVIARKILQKSRRYIVQTLFPSDVYSRLRNRWWRARRNYIDLPESAYWTSKYESVL